MEILADRPDIVIRSLTLGKIRSKSIEYLDIISAILECPEHTLLILYNILAVVIDTAAALRENRL